MAFGEYPGGNLRAYYRLEDENDLSGNGFTLTNVNSVGFNQGRFNNGADFGSSGTDKQLRRGINIFSSDSDVNFYLSFDFKLNSTANTTRDHLLIAINTSTRTRQARYIISGGILTFKLPSGSVTIPAETEWHNFEFTKNSDGESLVIDRKTTFGSITTSGSGFPNGIGIGNGVSVPASLQAFATIDEVIVAENYLNNTVANGGVGIRSRKYTQAKGRFCI